MSSVEGWSHYPVGVPCVETIKLVDRMWHREGQKDAMLLVMMKQMELLTNYVKGFHARNSHSIHDYDDGYYGNQDRNNVRFVDTSSQESTEVLPPHMESTLEVVLEKKRMNELASHMAAPTATNNTAPRNDIVDNDVLEWEIEEEAIEELIIDVFLKGEELEEIHQVHKEFRRIAKQQATTFPFPNLVSMLSMRAACPLLRSLDKTIQVHGVITLATKTDKEAPMIKRASEVNTLQQEVATLTAPTSQPMSCDSEAVPPQSEAPKSPPEDWWVGYHSDSNIISYEESYYSLPPLPPIRSMYDVNPSWALEGVVTISYHELRTLLDRWVLPGPGQPIVLPPDPMQPTAEDTTSWVFDVVTYTWKPRPNR
ncbi:hypothetical protein HAX54_023207 [Datura stramonium]|uniref:Uncharacterized protein n=1 Tax=Datura stramonium TaxID=4076 RepID=A0ABS8S4Q3_DATST|nr:hypothetical protein [Datura stramonium]